MSQHISVGTINSPAGYGVDAAETCWSKTAAHSDLHGMNEIGNTKVKVALDDLRKENGYDQFGLFRGPNPVFWDKDVYHAIGEGRQIELHGAKGGWRSRRWPGYNGARYATEQVIKPNAGGLEVAHIHTHWVPRGVKVSAWWRNKMRKISKQVVRKLIAAHRAAGRIVVLTGDLNIKGAFHMLEGFVWLVSAGVDKIGAMVPKGYKIINKVADKFSAPTDHGHGIWAAFDVVKVAS